MDLFAYYQALTILELRVLVIFMSCFELPLLPCITVTLALLFTTTLSYGIVPHSYLAALSLFAYIALKKFTSIVSYGIVTHSYLAASSLFAYIALK